MANKISSSGISNGSRITSSQLKQLTDALSASDLYAIQMSGSLDITGSATISDSITATSLSGEGSAITGVVSSSYSITSSHALTALTSISSSYAVSSSVTVVTEISSSFSTSASRADSAASVEFIDITGKPTLVSGSSQIDLASASGIAANATNAVTASYIDSVNINQPFLNITASGTISGSLLDINGSDMRIGVYDSGFGNSLNIASTTQDVFISSKTNGTASLNSTFGITKISSTAGKVQLGEGASIIELFTNVTSSGNIDANNINLVGEISSSTLDVASNGYIGGDLQVAGSVTSSALNLYGVDYKPWMLLGSAWFNAGESIGVDKIGPAWKNNSSAEPWPASTFPFQIYWNPDLVDISGQGKVEMSVRVLSNSDSGHNFGLYDGQDGFISASLSSPWTLKTDTTLSWVTASINGSDFAGKAFTNTSTNRILEFQAYNLGGGDTSFYGIYAIQIWARKI